MPKIKLQVPGEAKPLVVDCQIEGDAFSVQIGETVYQGSLVVTAPGEGWLSCQGKVIPFYLAQQQDVLSIWLQGRTYQLRLETGESRRAGGAGSAGLQAGEVKAPMPGTVLKVAVQTGDTVEAGQALVIMESMKMEMTLSAPEAAVVKDVLCRESQLVDMGAVLVKLEAVPDNS